MAINVTFYTFNKKKNSTLLPTGGTSFSCNLKDGCGVLAPQILLDTGNPSSYNYAHIPLFGRYYYVRDWFYNAGLWTASLAIDPLASWRDGIAAGSYYCTRCYNGLLRTTTQQSIADATYPGTAEVTIKQALAASPWAKSLNTGCYVISTMSNDNNGIGGMSTYVLTATQFGALKNFMFSSPAYLGIDDTELSEGMQKMAYNPGDYILSAMWLPLQAPTDGSTTVKFGWWDSGISASRIGETGVAEATVEFAIDKHPQSLNEAGGSNEYRYLNGAPYSKFHLYAPPFGEIELCPNDFLMDKKISCLVTIDAISGDGTMQIVSNNGVIGAASAHCAVDINLGAVVVNASDILSGGIGSAIGKAFNFGIGAVSSWIGGGDVGDVFESGYAALSSHVLGSKGGGFAAFVTGFWRIIEAFTNVTTPAPEEFGYPYCGVISPSVATGYYKMRNPHLEIAATDVEINQIVAEMEAGFFYE